MIEVLIAIPFTLLIVFSIFIIVLWGEDKYIWETMIFNESLGGTLYNWYLKITKVWNNFWKYFWK